MSKRVEAGFENTRLEALRKFLYEAQLKGYGGEEHRGEMISELMDEHGMLRREYESGVVEQICADGGTKIIWRQGNLRYSDKWFGGEPFGGMTVVRYKGKVCFTMQYYGEVKAGENLEAVYGCLKEALMAVDPRLPIRGARSYLKSGAMDRTVDLEYKRSIDGDLTSFSGSEYIAIPLSHVVYEATFMGGLVNLRDS